MCSGSSRDDDVDESKAKSSCCLVKLLWERDVCARRRPRTSLAFSW